MQGNSTLTEVVILFANEREYDLDRCVGIAEQALGLHAEGQIVTDDDIAPPEVGASVQLVDRDGECVFYFGAPEQALVIAQTGNGGFFRQGETAVQNQKPDIAEAIGSHRAWVRLALDQGSDGDIPPEQTMLLQKLTAGFMGDDGLLLHVPQHGLFVRGSAALRAALNVKPLAEALREARQA